MTDRYAVTGDNAVTPSPGDTTLSLNGIAARRAKIYDVLLGTTGTPADNALQHLLRRFTASGTGSAVVPIELDLDAPAATLTAENDHTVEPTYTAGSELLDTGINQRATFRWVAAPGGELYIPASLDAGIGHAPIHASYTGLSDCTFHFEE